MVPEPMCSKIMIKPLVSPKKKYPSSIHLLFCKIFLVEEHISNIGLQKHYFQERTFFFIVMYRFGNGAPICIVCIGWESQWLLYAGFFTECFSRGLGARLGGEGGMLLYTIKICCNVSISNY